MAKQEESKYRILVVRGDLSISSEELERQMKKVKGWTLSKVERIVEPGYVGFLLKLIFIK